MYLKYLLTKLDSIEINKSTDLKLQSYLKTCLQFCFKYPETVMLNLELINSITSFTILKGNEKSKSLSLEIWNSILHSNYEAKLKYLESNPSEDSIFEFPSLKYFPKLVKINISLLEYLSVEILPNKILIESVSN